MQPYVYATCCFDISTLLPHLSNKVTLKSRAAVQALLQFI